MHHTRSCPVALFDLHGVFFDLGALGLLQCPGTASPASIVFGDGYSVVKVQFRQDAYWVESEPTPHPFGEVLTELLNYDLAPYKHTLSVLEQALEEKDTQAALRAFMDAVRDLSALPYFRLFLSDLHKLNAGPVEGFVVGEAQTAFEEYIFQKENRTLPI